MFIFFQTFVSPIGLSDMAVITVNAFFPPNSLLWQWWRSQGSSSTQKGGQRSAPGKVGLQQVWESQPCSNWGHLGCMQIYSDDRRDQPQSQLPYFPGASSDGAIFRWMEPLQVSDTSLTSKSAGIKKRLEALANTGITSTPSIFSPFSAQPGLMAPDNTSREHNTIQKGLQHLYGKHEVLHSNKVQGKKKPTNNQHRETSWAGGD